MLEEHGVRGIWVSEVEHTGADLGWSSNCSRKKSMDAQATAYRSQAKPPIEL